MVQLLNYKGVEMIEKERKRYLFCTSIAFLIGNIGWALFLIVERKKFAARPGVVWHPSVYKDTFNPISEGLSGGYFCMFIISGILCYYYFMKHKPIWFQLIVLLLFFVRLEAVVVSYFWSSWYWTYLAFLYNLMKFWQTTKRWREYDDLY